MNPPAPLFSRVRGDGEPVLFLNGVSMTLSGWEELVRELPAGYQSVLCDFRGQLRSPGPPPGTQAAHVGDVLALLDSVGVRRAHVVGTSFGGSIALALAAAKPRRVATLSLVAVGAGENAAMRGAVRSWLEAAEAALAGEDPGELFDVMAPWIFSEEYLERDPKLRHVLREQLARAPQRWFRDLVGLLETVGEIMPTIPPGTIEVPALVLAGGADLLVPPERALELAARLPGAQLEILPGGGHALPIEQPVGVAKYVLGLIERHPLD